jgi:hypothetical protein
MLLPILGALAVAGVGAFFYWERHDMAKALIEADLRRAGVTLIRLELDWMDFDRDTLTYDVVYDSASGRRLHTRCKVAIRAGSDGNLYWTSPLE